MKTQDIQVFLKGSSTPLSALYNPSMECQVNVAQDEGERIDGEFKGRRWHGWTNHLEIEGRLYVWKSFRIPHKAKTEPEYDDTKINFSLEEHAEGIGMTGWNWKRRQSEWVAYDFDAIIGHSDKHLAKLSLSDYEAVRA